VAWALTSERELIRFATAVERFRIDHEAGRGAFGSVMELIGSIGEMPSSGAAPAKESEG
jgi:hypothetical protein